jgi:hypothetical protein
MHRPSRAEIARRKGALRSLGDCEPRDPGLKLPTLFTQSRTRNNEMGHWLACWGRCSHSPSREAIPSRR